MKSMICHNPIPLFDACFVLFMVDLLCAVLTDVKQYQLRATALLRNVGGTESLQSLRMVVISQSRIGHCFRNVVSVFNAMRKS